MTDVDAVTIIEVTIAENEEQSFREAARQVVAKLADCGCVVVPREPTEAVIRAVDAAAMDKWPNARAMAIAMHKAMIAAVESDR